MAGRVTFTWTPDPALYGAKLQAVAAAIENRTLPLAVASETMQGDIRERFETETDPEGNPWEDWADSYRDYAESYPNVGILRQDQELVDAASSSEAMVISHDAVFYRTDLLPSYGLAHESGLEQRKHPLPKRSFLGMSEEAAAVIFATFAEWFDRSIDLFITSTGRVGMRHALRGAGGFIPRSSVGKSPLPRIGR